MSNGNTLKDEDIVYQNLERLDVSKQVHSDNALLRKSDTSNLRKHNEEYTELLKAYVTDFKYNSAYKRKNKQQLFKVAKRLLIWIPIATILFMFVTLIVLACNKVDVWDTLPGLFASLATLLGTFLIIPKMITKYLFNKNEEKHLADIIGKIQEYDKEIRGDL